MTVTLRERTEHAAKYGANLVVPAREIKQLLDEGDEYDQLLTRTGEILTGVANALNGPPPALTTWSHHDLAEKAAALASSVQAVRERHSESRLVPGTPIYACAACGEINESEDCPTIQALDAVAALAEGGDDR